MQLILVDCDTINHPSQAGPPPPHNLTNLSLLDIILLGKKNLKYNCWVWSSWLRPPWLPSWCTSRSPAPKFSRGKNTCGGSRMILCGSGSASEFFSLVKHSLKGLLKNLIFKFYSLHFVIFI